MSEYVSMERRGPVAILKVDRPKALNALNGDTVRSLLACALEAERDPEIRVLVFYNEKNFGAGADIGTMVDSNPMAIKEFSFSDVFNRIEKLKLPTVAVMEGYCLGGGLELALACDFRIAAENCQIGFPEINLAVFPGAGGNIRMARLVGPSVTKELVFLGGRIDAARALTLGAVNRVVPNESLLEEAMAFAEKLAKKAPLALQAVKKVINFAVEEPDTEKATAYEKELFATLFATEDQKEGMRAFLDKRKPEFKGK